MKSPGKISVVILLAMLGVGAAAWVGTFFYWHVRIKGAIRELAPMGDWYVEPEAQKTIRSSGCRSLPYLVDAEASATKSNDQAYWAHLIYLCTSQDERLADLCLKFHINPEEHDRKRDAILAWWKQSGNHYHRWWRVWTSRCPVE